MLLFAITSGSTLLKVLGTVLAIAGIAACWRLATLRAVHFEGGRTVRLGAVKIAASSFYKMLAVLGLFLLPASTVGIANYHVFEGVKEVGSCSKCHVMRPLVNDMTDPLSSSLAARHFRNKWIPQQQCYACHTDYGLAGTLKAKTDGFRHLARYTTGTYSEPIIYRGTYQNQNCLKCHADTKRYDAVSSHQTVAQQLQESSMSCLNCHGMAHPSRDRRTPGHADYEELMNAFQNPVGGG
jgi:hypothetical protein